MTYLPNNRPSTRKGNLADRLHLGNCVRCHHGIYTGDEHHRGRGLWLGILCAICHFAINRTGAA